MKCVIRGTLKTLPQRTFLNLFNIWIFEARTRSFRKGICWGIISSVRYCEIFQSYPNHLCKRFLFRTFKVLRLRSNTYENTLHSKKAKWWVRVRLICYRRHSLLLTKLMISWYLSLFWITSRDYFVTEKPEYTIGLLKSNLEEQGIIHFNYFLLGVYLNIVVLNKLILLRFISKAK